MGRLAPLGLHNTRFRSVPVSCSPKDWCGRFDSPPRDPPERRQFQIPQIPEGLASPDELGLVRAVGAFGHGVVVRVADGVGRRQHPIFHNPGGVHRAGVLRAMVRVKPTSV